MHVNDFPTDTAEHVAQEALKGAGGDHDRSLDLLLSAIKVASLWHRLALDAPAPPPSAPSNDE